MKQILTILAALGTAMLLGPATAQQHDSHDHSAHDHSAHMETATPEEDVRIGDAWPLDTCVVAAGSKLGSMGDPIVMLHEGREVRFCCAGCVPRFEANPEQFLEAADKKITEMQEAHYPLQHCVVDTAEPISTNMPENITSVIGNRLFAFCCPGCENEARTNPAPFFEALDKAVAEAQVDDYPLDTCVVTGMGLDSMGGPYDIVHANQLVRFCCAGCEPRFDAAPVQHMKKIQDAREEAANESESPAADGGNEAGHH